MRTLDESIKNGTKGLHYGNRILLPFVIDIFKLIIDDEIITDFRFPKNPAEYIQHYDFTEIYFTQLKDVEEVVSKYETIKMVVVEKGKDIFNFDNHIVLALHLKEKHAIEIEVSPDDLLFVE
jgi:hypothetical protein